METLTDIIRHEIESRAFDIYEFRCEYNIPGDALSDWLQAEKEIKAWYNPNQKTHVELFYEQFDVKEA